MRFFGGDIGATGATEPGNRGRCLSILSSGANQGLPLLSGMTTTHDFGSQYTPHMTTSGVVFPQWLQAPQYPGFADVRSRFCRHPRDQLAMKAHFLVLAFGLLPSPAVAQGAIVRASVSSAGVQGNLGSTLSKVSADGNVVVFESQATNLVFGDTNSSMDVYVRRLSTGETLWASSMANGTAGYYGGYQPTVTADGAKIAFGTSTQLVPSDTNSHRDIYVRDLVTGSLTWASAAFNGTAGNGDSDLSDISGDGNYVVFDSIASNLVPFDANGGGYAAEDVFLVEVESGAIELIDVSSNGVQGDRSTYGSAINHDGRFVAFASYATNLVAGDTNDRFDVYRRDRLLGTTTRISVGPNGIQGDADSGIAGLDISSDGRYIAYDSRASTLVSGDTNNYVDVFVHDCTTGETARASVGVHGSQGNGHSEIGSISDDGNRIAFQSGATNLAPIWSPIGSSSVWVRDRALGATINVSVSASGEQPPTGYYAFSPAISGDGSTVVFSSHAPNLVPNDTNSSTDVFRVRIDQISPSVYCSATTTAQGCIPTMSWSGAPSTSSASAFVLRASGVPVQHFALLLYGTLRPKATPFMGSILCIAGPLKRIRAQLGGAHSICGGTAESDFNAHIASATDPALVEGAHVWTQFWIRDPAASNPAVLSNAVFFRIEP